MQFSSVENRLKLHTVFGSVDTGSLLELETSLAEIEKFSPDIVIFRPDSRAKSLLALLDRLAPTGIPVVFVVLDSWTERLRETDADSAFMWDEALDGWATRSVARFAVSQEMAKEWGERTGLVFDVVSNWVDSWAFSIEPIQEQPSKVSFLHSGMLGGDKAGFTASLLAMSFGMQQGKSADLTFQVYDHPLELSFAKALSGFRNVGFRSAPENQAGYRRSLMETDVNVVLFDFSPQSVGYLKNSFSNRIPELFAAARPILAIGPPEILNIDYLSKSGAALVVDQPSYEEISRAIKKLTDDFGFRNELAQQAQENAQNFDSRLLRSAFHQKIRMLSAGQKDSSKLKERYVTDPRKGKATTAGRELLDIEAHNKITEKDLNPGEADREIIDSLRGAHVGETCVIVGNGPSLNKTDLTLLNDQVVFASNAIFLLFDEVQWRPRYYAAVDTRFVPDRSEDVNQLLQENPEMLGFFPTTLKLHDGSNKELRTRGMIDSLPNRVLFRQLKRDPRKEDFASVSFDAQRGLVTPSTVTVTLLQLAAHMGFKKMVLIGCDTSYSVPKSTIRTGPEAPGTGGEKMLIKSTQDDDPNHFRPDYFGKDREWHHPKTEYMIAHYEAAWRVFEPAGLEVVNATVGGNLEVFPRQTLEEALKTSRKDNDRK